MLFLQFVLVVLLESGYMLRIPQPSFSYCQANLQSSVALIEREFGPVFAAECVIVFEGIGVRV